MDLGPPWTDGDAVIDRRDTLDCGKWHATHDINVGLGPLRVMVLTLACT
jgi:hypothetical protein